MSGGLLVHSTPTPDREAVMSEGYGRISVPELYITKHIDDAVRAAEENSPLIVIIDHDPQFMDAARRLAHFGLLRCINNSGSEYGEDLITSGADFRELRALQYEVFCYGFDFLPLKYGIEQAFRERYS